MTWCCRAGWNGPDLIRVFEHRAVAQGRGHGRRPVFVRLQIAGSMTAAWPSFWRSVRQWCWAVTAFLTVIMFIAMTRPGVAVSIVACTRYRRAPIPLSDQHFPFFWRPGGPQSEHPRTRTLCALTFESDHVSEVQPLCAVLTSFRGINSDKDLPLFAVPRACQCGVSTTKNNQHTSNV